ncbi:polymer-forming cytoskeletal protein [Hellea sp.]|nr:polymer-forming cytoskeletal protein [Hellea sp.]
MFNKINTSTSKTSDKQEIYIKKSHPPVQNKLAPSILGSDLTVIGDIKTKGDVHIDGRVDGNITASGVIIGEKGTVIGKIIARSARIRGNVTGKIDATKIELTETASVKADLTQDQLIIANGAFFDGKCNRKTSSKLKNEQIIIEDSNKNSTKL